MFVCSRGCRYSEWELELGMHASTLDWLVEKAEREHNLEADLEHEHKLGRAWLLGDSDCPWPWYADRPYEVQEM